MKISKLKELLQTAKTVHFTLEDGTAVPEHFHVTEVGIVTKHFIDCGGTVREEKVANLQLWDADDYEHRLKPQKLLNIIALSEKTLGMEDLEIEVEYQQTTIGRFDLGHQGEHFLLLAKKTACLAQENCGIPIATEKPKVRLSGLPLAKSTSCCSPESNCC